MRFELTVRLPSWLTRPVPSTTRRLQHYSTPGRIRTCDTRIRSPVLFPAELQGHGPSSWIRTNDFLTPNQAHFQAVLYSDISGTPGRVRTCDLAVMSRLLFQLSYESMHTITYTYAGWELNPHSDSYRLSALPLSYPHIILFSLFIDPISHDNRC